MIHGNSSLLLFFFFNDTATTEIYTLSLHDALPISSLPRSSARRPRPTACCWRATLTDRKSTRLNSSHSQISYAVFCLKKKKHDELLAREYKNYIVLHEVLRETFYSAGSLLSYHILY